MKKTRTERAFRWCDIRTAKHRKEGTLITYDDLLEGWNAGYTSRASEPQIAKRRSLKNGNL